MASSIAVPPHSRSDGMTKTSASRIMRAASGRPTQPCKQTAPPSFCSSIIARICASSSPPPIKSSWQRGSSATALANAGTSNCTPFQSTKRPENTNRTPPSGRLCLTGAGCQRSRSTPLSNSRTTRPRHPAGSALSVAPLAARRTAAFSLPGTRRLASCEAKRPSAIMPWVRVESKSANAGGKLIPPHNGPITTGTPTSYMKLRPLGVIGAGSSTTSILPARASSSAILRILACVEK